MATLTNTADTLLDPTERKHRRIFTEELYPHMDALYTFALRLTGDAFRAEDLVQDTFCQALKNISKYAEGTNAKAWLMRILFNNFVNEYRKAKRTRNDVNFDDILNYHNQDDVYNARYDFLGEDLSQLEFGDEILRALQALNPNQLATVLLDLEDFNYNEISKLTETELNTVRTRLARARDIMALHLAQYAKAQGFDVNKKKRGQQGIASDAKNLKK